MQTQAIEGKKKWAQPVWTPERRAKHGAGCQAAVERYRQFEAEIKWARDFRENWPGGPDKLDEILVLAHELKVKGIDPLALINFAIMVRKNKREPLTEDQDTKVHELLVQKFSAEGIYQHLFGTPATA